jgi:xanthine dehydrogenase accessory factor
MAVTKGGELTGPIGGGAVEYRVQQIAAQALIDKASVIKSFVLSADDKENLGMVCGGDVTVHIKYIPSDNQKARELFTRGSGLFSQNVDSWLLTRIKAGAEKESSETSEEELSELEIYTSGDKLRLPGGTDVFFGQKPACFEHNGSAYYAEPLTHAGRVYVFGGGHCSQELVPLLSHLGGGCVVFVSLPEFANEELFPTAVDRIVGDFENISENISVTENDYVVIMTRGHASDFTVQAQALRLKPKYVGVIGSRKKIAFVSQRLRDIGFSQADIDSVRTPIGLDIKADTPAEIAVSIAAELILVRARKD